MQRIVIIATIALATIVCLIAPVDANGYAKGYVSAEGYTYGGDGYWYYANKAYGRTYVPGCYSCGRYSAPYYSYYFSHDYQPYVAPAANDYGNSEVQALIELAKARDKFEGLIRVGQFKHQQILDTIKALGLEGNFRIQNYGPVAPYAYPAIQPAAYGNLQLSSAGVNGPTIWGYSSNSIRDVYGPDVSLLYQAAARSTDQAQTFGAEAHRNLLALADGDAKGRERIAAILAKAQAAQEVLRAMEIGSRTETKEFTFRVGPDGNVQKIDPGQPQPMAGQQNIRAIWEQSASKCVMCHSGADKKGGFAVADYPAFSVEQRVRVISRLVKSAPADKRMPRSDKGVAGEQMGDNEIAVWWAVK